MPKKYCLFALVLLLLLISAVSALSISAETPIVQGQQWSFKVEFSEVSNGTESQVYVDSEQILTIGKSQSGKLFVIDESSSKVINTTINGLDLSVVFVGLSEGNHIIKVEGDNYLDEFTVVFYKPMSKEEQQTLQSNLAALQVEISSLKNNISNLQSENESKDAQISSLQMENSSLANSIQYLESNINLLEQEGKTNEEILSQVKEDLNVLLTEREEAMKSPIAGMFAFGAQNSGLFFGIFVLIALVVVGVFIKSRTTSIYSSPILSKGENVKTNKIENSEDDLLRPKKASPIKSFVSRFGRKSSASKSFFKKKKWALEAYEPKESESKTKPDNKRFELGDLIKKN